MSKAIVRTYSGIDFDLLNPQPDMIVIEDIAHHLSLTCRFNGAVPCFYSVAEHSLLAESCVPNDATTTNRLRRAVLLHDAAEAYVGDCVTPLKQLLKNYQEIENLIQYRIFQKFCGHVSEGEKTYIKIVDRQALNYEFKCVFNQPEKFYCNLFEDKNRFLNRFLALTEG